MSFVLRNGTIHDGLGNTYKADILIVDSYIKKIGNDIPYCENEIDLSGLDIIPGIIDAHRHADFALINDKTGLAELSQGITSTIVGPCGMSVFPTTNMNKESWYAFIRPCLGDNGDYQFKSCNDFFNKLENHIPINVGTFVGMGTIKTAVKGFSQNSWTTEELEIANKMILSSLEEGALGISAGIMYTPECYSEKDDYVKLLDGVSDFDVPFVTHMRSEGDNLLSAVEEVIDIATASNVKLNISHFKVFGKENWRKTITKAIEVIDKARAEGKRINVDFYPYTGGSTTLMTLIPPCCLKDGTEETLKYLATKEGAEKLRNEIEKKQIDWDSMVQAIGWERIIISSISLDENKWMQGLSIDKIASKLGKECSDTVIDLLIAERGEVGIIVMSMDQADVDKVAALDYSNVISDSLYGAMDFPHPRLNGSFPRFIKDYVLDRKIMDFEEAIKKITSNIASLYGIKQRGSIVEGYYADLAILDLCKLKDNASFTDPKNLSDGIEMVFVNGCLSYKDKKVRNSSSGVVLRRC